MNSAPQLTEALSWDLGTMDYQEAHELQRRIQDCQIAGDLGPVILTVEHPPTITIGRRGGESEVVAPPAVLKARGVAVVETDRGGQVTYHGPGQLVVYPLVQVQSLGLHEYLRLMEQSVMDVLEEYGLSPYRVEGRTGVWVKKEKICAMGIRVRKWWTLHGLALNITTDLNHFGLIIPCGIRDRGVTSLERQVNPCPQREDVQARLLERLATRLNFSLSADLPEELKKLREIR